MRVRKLLKKALMGVLVLCMLLNISGIRTLAEEKASPVEDEAQMTEDETSAVKEETEETGETEETEETPEPEGEDFFETLEALAKGAEVSGSFAAAEGYDIATVRYVYAENGNETYGFAEISGSAQEGYTYTFKAPTDNFEARESTSLNPVSGANIIAEYYKLSVWDGAVDVSWYNETDSDFYIYNPAQLAGAAAIVNGSIDGATKDYQVKGQRSKPEDRTVNRGLPDSIKADYFEDTNLIAGVRGSAYKGVMANDFSDKTIHIMADMDMGGAPGSEIIMGDYDISVDQPNSNWNRNLYDYPNWTPIGGEYLMDVSDSGTMNISFFNGSIEGHGHNINNLYCYRWSYRSVGETAFGYSQGVGFVGDMGTLYNDSRGKEENPDMTPSIRNLGLSGFVYGRRMVGGFVGCIGGGSNAADGTTASRGVNLENLANHTYVYCTDSKGLGGIVGSSMSTGSIINCYNDGNIKANYAAPTGGIVGANEGMDIFCCYNIGNIYGLQERGRGIGGDRSGKDYTADNCYYLENCSNDTVYPGYYAYNLAPSVKINVVSMSEDQMKSNELLGGLNANGTAYVSGDAGYPKLYWEKESGTGNLTIESAAGGAITPSKNGSMENGTIVYLSHTVNAGWNFRNYILNGNAVSGDYITINGSSVVSANYESVKAGVLKISLHKDCTVTIKKNGTIVENGVSKPVTNYPVSEGDPLFEGDVLMVEAAVKKDATPADLSQDYKYHTGEENPFNFSYQYTGSSEKITNAVTYTVGSEIGGQEVSLTLKITPLTTQKLWKHIGATDWYKESENEFVIKTPEELAGVAKLVESGVTFAGKTIKLGNDISLRNTDGTTGRRFWSGIGLPATASHTLKVFSGTFDGQGHKITDFSGNKNGLFTYCYGDSGTARAIIRNLSVYGEAKGENACGITASAKNALIENCHSFCKIEGDALAGSNHSAGIVGYAISNCEIKKCVNYGSINASYYVGGIAGETGASSCRLSDCINKGDITSFFKKASNVGGVAGKLSGELISCANYGNIAAWGQRIGGVAGASVAAKASVKNCYNVGSLTYEEGFNSLDCIGGIIGFASFHQVYNSFNYGKIIAKKEVSYQGAVFGNDYKKSTSKTENVYFLESSCQYAENHLTFEELPSDAYCAGIRKASVEEFANKNSVLAKINGDKVFDLGSAKYPEFNNLSGLHVHKGGKATCTKKAVCELCGLEYNDVNPDHHADLVLTKQKEAVWTSDGYTGDKCCRDCGKIVEKGKTIPADTSVHAITVNVYARDKLSKTKAYTVEQFDKLKTSSPAIGYSYGTKSTEIMVCTEYVTIDHILKDFGYQPAQLGKLEVVCPGTKDTVSAETLKICHKFYYADGTELEAPAAVGIAYATLSGTIEEVAHEAKQTDSLRFGYGMSKEQFDKGESLGGRRLVSPVTTLNIYLNLTGAIVSGTITGYSGTDQVKLSLIKEGEGSAAYETTGKTEYSFEDVADGKYTLRISAGDRYAAHDYHVSVQGNDLTVDTCIYQIGDVNMDGDIRTSDVSLIERHVKGVKVLRDPYAQQLADVDQNGEIQPEDAVLTAKRVF